MTKTMLLGRRAAIVAGVALALLVAAASIRSAAVWASSSAPLTVAPVTVEVLQARLADEQARSEALRADLAAMTSHAAELDQALSAVGGQVDAGAAAAADVDARLVAAKTRLVKLQTLITRAEQQLAVTLRAAKARAAAAPAAAATGGEKEHDDD